VNLFRSARAVACASGDGVVDWNAVGEAARSATNPGSIDLSNAERDGFATDVRDARDRIGEVGNLEFDLPDAIEVQHRHHWIDANVTTFSRVMEPLERQATFVPGLARIANTGSMSFMMAFLSRNVLGQYDPLLLADSEDAQHALYFVRPNIVDVAGKLDVDYDRFRRWIAFHEVTHAAEFGAAPWLTDYMEERMNEAIGSLSEGDFAIGQVDRMEDMFGELNATMTVVEGYAELLMDEAFDEEYDDLRAKLEARRQGGAPLNQLIKRMLGLNVKRRQYERGKAFFDEVTEQRGVAAAGRVWDGPENLPTDEEIDDPGAWIERVDP